MKMDIETKWRKDSGARQTRPVRGPAKQNKQVGYKSIVVPIDFSETSLKALDFALALAEEFGSRVHLVHVLEFPAVFNSTSQPSYALWDKEAKKTAATRLAKLVDEKVEESIAVKHEVRFGRAYRTICDTALEQKADLIVIGTHGFTGLKHLLLGSTAERVIRHAPCSVLTIRSQHARNAKSILKLKKILAPTDFSKAADEALQSAVALAKQYSAQLHLLYVVPVHYAVGEYDQTEYRLLEVEEMEVGQKNLASLSEKLLAKEISVKTKIRHGRPATEITEASEELASDLIVIATHGITGWRHAFLGSVTEEVVRHSTCPVLIVRNL